MAPTRRRKKKARAAGAPPPPPEVMVIDPADRLSKLPEEVQARILSFLPAQEAVRTCVLARTWRDVWKLTRRLLIPVPSFAEEAREFIDRLLRVRLDGLNDACLDATEIRFDFDPLALGLSLRTFKDAEDHLSRWIRGVLNCRIQMLRLDTFVLEVDLGWPLVSPHLTRLELTGVRLVCRCLDLDACPALRHLQMENSALQGVMKVKSKSLQRLLIKSCDCETPGYHKRIKICLPRLVYLCLESMEGFDSAPVLERMPDLVGAQVWMDSQDGVFNCDENTTQSVVLEGLAQAKDLMLIDGCRKYIFRRDLRWCPTFSKLKTLILNAYWCDSTDCSALACMLEHAPVLEKLTVLFSSEVEPTYDIVVEGRPDAAATGKTTIVSQRLQLIELKCVEVHQMVVDVMKFLSTLYYIWFQIRVAGGTK